MGMYALLNCWYGQKGIRDNSFTFLIPKCYAIWDLPVPTGWFGKWWVRFQDITKPE